MRRHRPLEALPTDMNIHIHGVAAAACVASIGYFPCASISMGDLGKQTGLNLF
jgi:hypothetical protein